MESKIYEYLAAKFMQDLRSNRPIDDDLALALHAQPQIDYIRAEVKQSDIPRLLELANLTQPKGIQQLTLSLLKARKTDERVKAFFRDLWNSDLEFSYRRNLMWRVLDDPDLDTATHESCYKFVMEDWDQWISDMVKWHRGPKAVVESVKERLENDSTPRSKDWAYLCVSVGAPDKSEVRSLLSQYTDSPESIVSRVAKELLDKLQ